MTLIEIAMVAGILMLVTAIAVPNLTNLTWLDLRTGARKLAGAIRYSYELSARKSIPYRMVLDLDERAWWMEGTGESVLLDREKAQVRDGALTHAAPRSRSRFVTRSFIEGGDMWKPKESPAFQAYGDMLSPKVTLPARVHIQSVWASHQAETVTSGQAYLYFFPSGETVQALIHLADEDGNVFHLQVDPLTGRVQTGTGEREEPRG
jgi:general secretion pathway protein H